LLLLVTAGAPVAFAQSTGSIKGKMIDKDTKGPLPFGNVLVVGTTLGVMTREDGTFVLPNVPAGVHQIQGSYLGYEDITIDRVRVEAGVATPLDLVMKPTIATETEVIEVTGEKALVEVDVTATTRTISAEELKTAPVTTVKDVLVQQIGVTVQDDEIHIRGGRSDETQYRIDGVVVKDLISGRSAGGEVAATSVSEINVITGGYNAEYGDALSGVVDIKTREGGDSIRTYTEWKSDHFPVVGGIYEDYMRDEVNFRSEGPEPVTQMLLPLLGWKPPGKITYFLSLNAVFNDGYLPGQSSGNPAPVGDEDIDLDRTLRSSYEDNLLGWIYPYISGNWSPRLDNDWRLFSKLTWRLGNKDKMNFTMSKNITIDHGFSDPPIIRRDVTDDTNYPWANSQRLDHYYTYTKDSSVFSLAWDRLWSKTTTTNMRVSRTFNCYNQDVFGRLWYGDEAYEEGDDAALPNCGDSLDTDGDGSFDSVADDSCDTPFFVDTGDAPRWHNRYVESYTTYVEMNRRLGSRSTLKTGWENAFQNVQYVDIRFPWVADPDNLGGSHDLYHVYPATGAFFVQDEFEFEGFIGNVGLRYDYWFPGKQADEAVKDTSRAMYNSVIEEEYERDTYELFGRRVKGNLLPRLAVSHPITNHTHLFLNYGHFAQRPSYFYVYSKISSVSSEDFPLVGNLNLNPERAVQYEMGLRHEFTRTLSGDVTFFYKDIYDYPTSVRFSKPGQGDFFIYVNNDFARSRGFELQVKKRRNPFLSGAISYAYSVATGKASDPNQTQFLQETEGAFAEIGIEEGYLWWNQPHKFTVSVDYGVSERTDPSRVPSIFGMRLPRDWFVNLYYLVRSGRAYTPEDELGNETGKKFSKNAPVNTTLDLRAEKGFRIAGRRLAIGVEGRNMLNTRYPTRVDPVTGEIPTLGEGQHQQLPSDPEALASEQLRFQDPSWMSPPRSVWLGIGVDW
jgi:outer membrane receptor protein involved in Fe transport